MELIVINQSKMKIILSKEDLRSFGLENDFVYNKSSADSLKKIIAWASEKTGKDCVSPKTSVTFFPSKDGGCELFLSFLAQSDENYDKHIPKTDTYSSNSPVRKHDLPLCIVCFDKDFENILSLCKALNARNYPFYSSLFIDENKNYALALHCKKDSASILLKNAFSKYKGIVSEFTKSYIQNIDFEFLCEHYKPLCKENAIQSFCSVFD